MHELSLCKCISGIEKKDAAGQQSCQNGEPKAQPGARGSPVLDKGQPCHAQAQDLHHLVADT